MLILPWPFSSSLRLLQIHPCQPGWLSPLCPPALSPRLWGGRWGGRWRRLGSWLPRFPHRCHLLGRSRVIRAGGTRPLCFGRFGAVGGCGDGGTGWAKRRRGDRWSPPKGLRGGVHRPLAPDCRPRRALPLGRDRAAQAEHPPSGLQPPSPARLGGPAPFPRLPAEGLLRTQGRDRGWVPSGSR